VFGFATSKNQIGRSLHLVLPAILRECSAVHRARFRGLAATTEGARLSSEADTRGGSRIPPWSWLILVLALAVGLVSYLVASSGSGDPQSQAIVGLSDDVSPAFFAQERALTVERALEAGLTIAIESEVNLEIVPAPDDMTQVFVNASGPNQLANAEEANRVAVATVGLSEQAARIHLDEELARLEQLELAQVEERDGVQASLTAAFEAGGEDAMASSDAVRLDQQLRSLETLISEVQAEQAELESRGIQSSAVLISRAREVSPSSSSALFAGVLGAVAGALLGLVLVAGMAARRKITQPSGDPVELQGTGSKRRFEDPEGLGLSIVARDTGDSEETDALVIDARKRFADPTGDNASPVVASPAQGSEKLDSPLIDARLATGFLNERFEYRQQVIPEPEEEIAGVSRYGQQDPMVPQPENGSGHVVRYGVDRTLIEDQVEDNADLASLANDSTTEQPDSLETDAPSIEEDVIIDLTERDPVIDLTPETSEEDSDLGAESRVDTTPNTDWPTFSSVLGRRLERQSDVSSAGLVPLAPLETDKPLEPLEPLDLDTSRVRALIEDAQETLSSE